MGLHTKLETEQLIQDVEFHWKIKNFFHLSSVVESPPFYPIPECSSKWLLQLIFSDNIMQLKIKRLDGTTTMAKLRITGDITLENIQREMIEQFRLNTVLPANSSFTCFDMNYLITDKGQYILPKLIEKCITLVDDTLIVKCCFNLCGPSFSVLTPKDCSCPEKDTMRAIYNERTFADIEFHFGGEVIQAHKAILSARSPVLKKMFLNNETKISNIDIKDYGFKVFDIFIKYLYTREVENDTILDEEFLLTLYELASKYSVPDLQINCANILFSSFLNEDSTLRFLKAADIHNDLSLKEALLEVIHKNFPEITTEKWSIFLSQNVKLASEIVKFENLRPIS